MKELAKRRIEFEQCAWNYREFLNFGDMTQSECLWRMGFAPTHPGPYFSGGLPLPMMDPFPRDNDFTSPGALRKQLALVDGKDGKQREKEQLSWMVSWHIKERGMRLSLSNDSTIASEVISAIRALQNYQSKVHKFSSLHV